jgi:hypothetical protein
VSNVNKRSAVGMADGKFSSNRNVGAVTLSTVAKGS